MKTKDHLFELIRSLSKSEISFFKKYSQLYSKGKQPTYVLIFKEMLKSKELDEKKLKAKIGNSYAVHKHQLFEKLIAALREMYAQSGNVNKSMNYMFVASVAARKQLYHISEYLLDKAEKQLEEDSVSVTPPLLIQHFRMMLLKNPHKLNLDMGELESIYEQTQLAASDYLTHHEVNYLTTKTQYILHSKDMSNASLLLEEIASNRLIKEYQSIPNLMDKMNALKIKYKILGYQKKHEEAFQLMKEEIEIVSKEIRLVSLNPMNYLVPLYNITKEAIRLHKLEIAGNYLSKALSIEKDYKIPENSALKTAIYSYTTPLRAKLLASQKPQQIDLVEIEELLELNEIHDERGAKVSLSHRIHFYLAIAQIKLKEYSEALGLLAAFEMEQHEKKILDTYQTAIEVLRLICFFELEMVEVLDAKIRSVYRRKTTHEIDGVLGLFKDLQKRIDMNKTFSKWKDQIHFANEFDETFVHLFKFWMNSWLN